jgi:Uncharacterized protein conserved in bacteria
MKWLSSNYVLTVGFCSWFSAQVLKTLLTLFTTRKLVLERLFGAGGMPSSHSALVCSVAVAIAKQLGYSSPEFGLAFAFASIVMYDAMGVRRAAGEQAKVLNKIIFELPPPKWEQEDGEEPLWDKKLKEFLGHTPVEVLGGCILGITIALSMPTPRI